MKKKIFTLLITALVFSSAVFALKEEKAHGVDGFYNFTADKLKEEGLFAVQNQVGQAVKGHWAYENDYVRVWYGMNNKNAVPGWRADWSLRPEYSSAPLKMTSKYPVLAFKVGLPDSVFWKGAANTNSTTGEGTFVFKVDIWGFIEGEVIKPASGNPPGRKIYVNQSQIQGSIKNAPDSASKRSSVTDRGCVRLKSDEPCQYIFYYNFNDTISKYGKMDFAPILARMADGYRPIPVVGRDTTWKSAQIVNKIDTIYTDETKLVILRFDTTWITGLVIDNVVYDTIAPQYYIKWFKTFPSIDSLNIAIRSNFGDDMPDGKTSYQKSLYETLYAAEQLKTTYSTSNYEALAAFTDSSLKYEDIYYVTQPQITGDSAEWKTWDAQLQSAVIRMKDINATFVSDLSWKKGSDYLFTISCVGDGKKLTIGDDLKVGTINGKKLIWTDTGSPFFATQLTGSLNNRTTYTLTNGGYYVGLYKDTLFMVPSANRNSAITNVSFVNRDASEAYYDFGAGTNFMNSDQTRLVRSSTFPLELEGTTPYTYYLFELNPYQYVQGADPDGYFGWEFNESTEGWAKNNYRQASTVEQLVVDGLGCAKFGVSSTYLDNTVGRPVMTTTFPYQPGYRREFGSFATGEYPDEFELSPKSDSLKHRPLDYAVTTNAGVNRFLAIKMAATDTTMDLSKLSLTLYANSADQTNLNVNHKVDLKGDVWVYDLVPAGVPYGGKVMVDQYLSFGSMNFPTAYDCVMIDWARTYKTVAEIPTESMPSVLVSSRMVQKETTEVYAYATSGTLHIENLTNAVAKVSIYSITGTLVRSINVKDKFSAVSMPQGLYLVKATSGKQTNVQKILVR